MKNDPKEATAIIVVVIMIVVITRIAVVTILGVLSLVAGSGRLSYNNYFSARLPGPSVPSASARTCLGKENHSKICGALKKTDL